jgi:methylglutaconyl-CoA hydratase
MQMVNHMNYTHLDYRVHDRVAYITLNRPEKRNAFNAVLVKELAQSFAAAEKAGEVRVIVLRANGNAFCAGADLEYIQELSRFTFEENLEDSQSLMRLFTQMYKLKKPIIAQVQGPALAGGCGLATVCDIIVASENAVFGYPEARIGFVAALVMIFLVRRMGEGRARELLLTARTLSAHEAQTFGLINEVTAHENLDEKVQEYCTQLSREVSGSSIAITKEILAKVHGMELQNALDFAARMNAATRMTNDCKRGITAFLNKEKIEW